MRQFITAYAALAVTLSLCACGPQIEDEDQEPQQICETMTPPDQVEACLVDDFGETNVWQAEDFEPLCDSRCDTVKSLRIDSPDIRTLAPLQNVREVQYGFELDRVFELKSLEGLNNLEVVGSERGVHFNILSMESLEHTDGFDSLRTITADELWIYDNPALRDVSGFPALERLEGRLNISSNYRLERISGLQNLDYVDGDVLISGNPQLPRCEAEKLVERIDTITGEVTIENNASGNCD